MSPHIRNTLSFGCAFVLVILASVAARAEFPPEGAIPDPKNPSLASGDYQDPAHNGVMRHYIFYFDCGKRDWIGVSVADTKGDQSAPPQAVGKGREFPPGPPPGSKVDANNSSRASLASSGQAFSLRRGVWFDLNTGKPMASPKLCPSDQTAPDQNRAGSPSDPEHGADDRKPDQLPPPPKYKIPDHSGQSHS